MDSQPQVISIGWSTNCFEQRSSTRWYAPYNHQTCAVVNPRLPWDSGTRQSNHPANGNPRCRHPTNGSRQSSRINGVHHYSSQIIGPRHNKNTSSGRHRSKSPVSGIQRRFAIRLDLFTRKAPPSHYHIHAQSKTMESAVENKEEQERDMTSTQAQIQAIQGHTRATTVVQREGTLRQPTLPKYTRQMAGGTTMMFSRWR